MTNWIWNELGTISLLESHTERGVIILDVRDLSDVETDIMKVQNKIVIGANLLSLGHKVAVRCVGGINRSNAIALGIMCYMVWINRDWSLEEIYDHHWKILKKAVPRAHITYQLEKTLKKALERLVEWDKCAKFRKKN